MTPSDPVINLKYLTYGLTINTGKQVQESDFVISLPEEDIQRLGADLIERVLYNI